MCRFLLAKSKNKIKPGKLLSQFASMCEKSHAPDGDWQGDGWGIALKIPNSKFQIPNWKTYKSLKPIWKDKNTFNKFPETNVFIVHARSAGFPHHKGNIEYNQPFISDDLCFVFNGVIKGVKLAKPLEGRIGAQKIFSLIQDVILNDPEPAEGESKDPQRLREALNTVDKLIINNSNKVIGMNIGLVNDNKFYILCEYENNADYFGIKYYQDKFRTLVCSESIGKYNWQMMEKGDTINL